MRSILQLLATVALLCLGAIACDLQDNSGNGEIGDAPPIPDDGRPACEDIELSDDESALYEDLMHAREDEGLSRIPLSASLTLVAQLHAEDAYANPDIFTGSGDDRCNLHSWSTSRDWSGCCYTGDQDGECMWSKPYEISNFAGDGYEIAYRGGGAPSRMVDAWLDSKGHRDVLLNRDGWSTLPFESIGVGISTKNGPQGERFAYVWFAQEPDCE